MLGGFASLFFKSTLLFKYYLTIKRYVFVQFIFFLTQYMLVGAFVTVLVAADGLLGQLVLSKP